MAIEKIELVIQPEDKREYDSLIKLYGTPDAFLHEAIKTLAARDRAERLAVLGAKAANTIVEQWGRVLTEDENTALTQLYYKSRGRDFTSQITELQTRVRAGEALDLVAILDDLRK